VRIAILGNYATQFLKRSLARRARNWGHPVDIHEADYNTVDLELLDEDSGTYAFAPDVVVWHESTLALRDRFYNTPPAERDGFAEAYAARVGRLAERIAARLPAARILFPNHALAFDDNVFGHYALKIPSSWSFQVAKAGHLLHELAARQRNLFLLNARPPEGAVEVTDWTQVVNADLHFTPAYLDWLAGSVETVIGTLGGRFRKCVVLDLDNTLWGGVIGDDGMEGIQVGALGIGKAFTQFQKWLRELARRGIILAVCSKNNEDTAREPFLRHPEMVLRLDDIAVFVANWESKADNIARIRETLNIGFDAMVFLDDNPAEREIVRRHLPEVLVPELPEDPAAYLPFLIAANLFETASHSANDGERTRQYQEEFRRQELSRSVTDMDEFLRSLGMTARVTPFGEEDVERIAQLTQRSNQFNLRTVRYTAADIRLLAADPDCETFGVQLSDRFGNYGLISVVIVRCRPEGVTAEIDTWIMSCRVLKRTVEALLMNEVVERLRARGIERLSGEYLPTPKNALVAQLLPGLGMAADGGHRHVLELARHIPLKTHITKT
jgi:FkbH-like protein